MVSIKRIEEFLLKNEKSESEDGLERRDSMVIIDTKRESIFLKYNIFCDKNPK